MAEWIGQTVGNYRIEAALGAGGMGQVFRARHVHLEREAALKVLHANVASNADFVARFRQEARSVAALRHPHIVEVYDFGEQDGACYLAMELVTGGALRGFLRRRDEPSSGWSLPLGLELVRQAALALHFAHDKGVIHRDVKPDNILLVPETGATWAWSARLSDFGLARLTENSIQTASGVTMGTPAYISPEQCQGGEVDRRTDLYSLGIVLYEVATGLLPFSVKTLSDAVYKHVHTPPPPPRTVAPHLSLDLEAIILRCIAKSPDDRFATGADLANALATAISALQSPGQNQVTQHGGGRATFVPDAAALAAAAQASIIAPPPPTPPSLTGGVRTVVGGGSAPGLGDAPALVSVLGSSALPRVQVLDAQGNPLRTVEMGGDGLTIGRLPDNDLVLDDGAVSRHHLRLDWDGALVTVTDLGSANGSFVSGGARLAAQAPARWGWSDALQIGPFFLRLIAPASVAANAGAGRAVAAPGTGPVADGAPNGIGVALEEESLALAPGKPEALRITVANLGREVEHLEVTVDGVPAAWVRAPAKATQLNPGAQATVALSVEAPRTPQSRVGEYPVTVRVRSRQTPERFGEAVGRWTVLPFAGGGVEMAPLKRSGMTSARFTLNVRNDGNAHARWNFAATDDEQALTYAFDPPQADLEPGEAVVARLTVQAPRRWLGSAQTRPFTVRATPQSDDVSGGPVAPAGGGGGGGAAQSVAGQFVHRALLPAWAPAAVIAVCAAAPFLWNAVKPGDKTDANGIVLASPVPGPSAPDGDPVEEPSPAPEPTAEDNPKPDDTPTPDAKPSPPVEASPSPEASPLTNPADAAEVQRVALARLKIMRDRLQSARATLDAVKDVVAVVASAPVTRPPSSGGIVLPNSAKYRDGRFSNTEIIRVRQEAAPSLRERIDARGIRRPYYSPRPLATPPAPPDMTAQNAAASRMPELAAHLAQAWGAIAGFGLGDKPLTQPFALTGAADGMWNPETFQDFGAPQFNSLGLKEMYSRLLDDQNQTGRRRTSAERGFAQSVHAYAHPTNYPLRDVHARLDGYRAAPATVGGERYKADMALLDQWLTRVERDLYAVETRFQPSGH